MAWCGGQRYQWWQQATFENLRQPTRCVLCGAKSLTLSHSVFDLLSCSSGVRPKMVGANIRLELAYLVIQCADALDVFEPACGFLHARCDD